MTNFVGMVKLYYMKQYTNESQRNVKVLNVKATLKQKNLKKIIEKLELSYQTQILYA